MVQARPVQAETILRFAHSESTTNIRHAAVEFYAKRLEELTKGDLKVEIFPSGQMGTHTQCQEMVLHRRPGLLSHYRRSGFGVRRETVLRN
jgi:TRAP-type C4-dicarboxylate transport system substrate-binding protein